MARTRNTGCVGSARNEPLRHGPLRGGYAARVGSRRGQSLVETCLAVGLLCLILMGLLQVSRLFAAREILHHAAARAARARTVGFNHWMVRKCVRVAAIPNAGQMLVPEIDRSDYRLRAAMRRFRPGELWDWTLGETPVSRQAGVERARIPEYLASDTSWTAGNVLDYEYWDSVGHAIQSVPLPGEAAEMLESEAWQDVPLTLPLHQAFYAAPNVHVRVQSGIENHYTLYLNDLQY